MTGSIFSILVAEVFPRLFGKSAVRLKQLVVHTKLHLIKTAGSCTGATASGIPDNQQFIPCHAGLDCSTSTLPHKNFSIIAGHFTWRELQRVDLQNFDCIVSVRRPADRVMSCLSFFYPRKVMESVQNMSRYYLITCHSPNLFIVNAKGLTQLSPQASKGTDETGQKQ